MKDIIIIIVIMIVVGAAAAYLIRSKIKGQKCAGCPYCNDCKKRSCPSSASCANGEENTDQTKNDA
ncbi:MAG: hypothetical protein IKL81_02445 [Clostridia bacterium]|nr:hypothetical protein [Clostridia bacterium]